MEYGKYCAACKDGFCLGSVCAGRKITRCEDVFSEHLCDWFEQKYVEYIESQKQESKEACQTATIQEILLKYFGKISCATCERFSCKDDRCVVCESYWGLDEYVAYQLAERIIKAIKG